MPDVMMVCVLYVPQSHKISHDVNTGVIQMTVDHFSKANEATYTVQIHDGRAKNQSSLVLVRDGERGFNIQYVRPGFIYYLKLFQILYLGLIQFPGAIEPIE